MKDKEIEYIRGVGDTEKYFFNAPVPVSNFKYLSGKKRCCYSGEFYLFENEINSDMLKIYSKRENEDDYVYLGPYKLSFVIKFIDEDQEHLCGLQLLNLENQIYIPEGIVVPKRMCPNKNKDKNREKFIIFNSGEFKNKNNVHDSGHIVGVNFKFVIRKLSCEYGRWVRMILDLDSPSNFLYK